MDINRRFTHSHIFLVYLMFSVSIQDVEGSIGGKAAYSMFPKRLVILWGDSGLRLNNQRQVQESM